ncbi:D-alanyl-D-alanine carboxypeptidase family protein [Sphingomicrobium flavum]|uniref:D-alanyl-D-alanine carboxypeptidase family protein n=1 Tax=Sphingomicrobium flavum TaxID=1229164 RepID=UPI0021AD75EB|nr:D-alanyl-D-alanine carboxypeptidase family protein [Sphingomicrobium flavum]
MRKTLLVATALALALPLNAQPAFETPARSAFLIDLSSGRVLFEKDADLQIPPASMAKMMTTEVAFELIASGKLDEQKMCTVRPETWRQWSNAGSTMFLAVNEQVSVENLLHGVVTVSGNDASVVLAECIGGTEEAFVGQMNALAKELGLTNSRFGNSNGWPDEGQTLVTARDLATLAKAGIERHPDLYKKYYGQREFQWGTRTNGEPVKAQPNRNPIMGRVEGADGLKTGHTEEAGYGFTGSAERGGRRLVMVVTGLDSQSQRTTESVRLMEWGFNAWESLSLYEEGAKVGEASVQLGGAETVGLLAPRALAATFPKNAFDDPSIAIRYQGPIKAPIAKGDHIADLVVKTAEGESLLPLVAADDVEMAGFFRKAWIGFKQLVGMA